MNEPADLYDKAHSTHYDEDNPDAALPLYRQLIEQFPDAPEAGYAKTQCQNILDREERRKRRVEAKRPRTLEEKVAVGFHCRRGACQSRTCRIDRVPLTSSATPYRGQAPPSHFAITCTECGLTSLYDLSVLTERYR